MTVFKAIFLGGCVLTGVFNFHPLLPASSFRKASSAKVDTVKIDPETGLANDSNLMLIKAQCTACHSSKLILQHRFTRAGWLDRIRWMQKYHKLWDLGESERLVLDYLEKNYGPHSGEAKTTFRRAPLKNVQWYKLD